MSAPLLVLLIALTAVRLTRLAARDTFPPVAAARERVVARWGAESWQAYLAECPWCLGVYLAGAVTLGADLTVSGGVPAPLLTWGAAAWLAGAAVAWEPDQEDE